MSGIRKISSILSAINTADGSIVTPDENGDVTLTTATYVFVLMGASDAPLQSVQLRCNAAIAFSTTGTFIETCNLPRNTDKTSVARGDQVSDYDTTTGNWIKEDPSTAYIGTTGTGWTVTNMTLTKTAGLGGAMIHLGNMGALRSRLNVTVTTAGKLCVASHGKD